jgi:L-alanine-DL-glutamate epimerase-like enolase superfamily enzyme
MRIDRVGVEATVQPYQDKAWQFALAKRTETHGLVIRLGTDDGPEGVAYATAALHVGEVLGGMRQVVEEVFTPILTGADPFDIESTMARLDAAVLGYPKTKAAIEVALYDTVGKALGVPLYKLWGGAYRTEIAVIRIIPIKAPADMARNAEKVVADGYRFLKIKVGHDAREDVERIREIRRAVGPAIGLTLDANQGWANAKVAIDALRRMEEYDVDIIEQPVRADDLAGLAEVKASVRMLVEADESARSVVDVYQLARAGCVDAVSLKTPKLGGPRNVTKAAAICQAANLHCRIGMGGANRLISAVDMHVIASTANIDYACEVGEFARMETDPTEGVEIVNGMLSVPDRPGHGADIRPVAAGR